MSFLFVVTRTESYCCQRPVKPKEEETEEVTASLVAAKEMSIDPEKKLIFLTPVWLWQEFFKKTLRHIEARYAAPMRVAPVDKSMVAPSHR